MTYDISSQPFWSQWPAQGGRVRVFGLGELRPVLLSLLEEGPKHGYRLMKELGERAGGAYCASAGSIYPALQQLHAERLVAVRTEQGRKIYRLTKLGRAAAVKDAETIRQLWSRLGSRLGSRPRSRVGAQLGEREDMGPSQNYVAFLGPMTEVAKALGRAGAWASGDADREDQLRGILRRIARELEGLTHES
jgi:DNA-binding PadR family transcriptional regulator